MSDGMKDKLARMKTVYRSARPKTVREASHDEASALPFSRKVLIAVISLLILIFFWVLLKAVVRLNAETEDRTRNFTSLAVMVDKAKSETVTLSVNVQGEARPGIEIDLVPQVGGKIVYVSPDFIEGGIFRKGQELLRIEDLDFKANVVRAQSAVAQAEQSLVREIAESDIARQDYAELGTGTPSALALRQPQRAQAEAALSAAKAELDTANLQLGRTSVRAPFDGRVRSKSADIGQFVNPGARLASIFSTDITEVRLALSDSDLAKLDLPIAFFAKKRADAPDVKLSALIGGERRYWDGKIMRTDSAYDTQTRALIAIAEVADPYGAGASQGGYPLAPGLYVDATIVGKTLENVITFKRDGLRPGNEIFIVDNKGVATIHQAVVLDTNEERAVIRSGANEGNLIVLSPLEKSRISTPLQAIDVNDPSITLVTPVNPRANAPVEDVKELGFWAKLFPEKEIDPDTLDRQGQKDLIDALSAQYAAVLRGMSETEADNFRKLSDKEKGDFIIKKLSSQASETPSGMGGRPNGAGRPGGN